MSPACGGRSLPYALVAAQDILCGHKGAVAMRVLLSEASSLTARETLTVLGREGVNVEAVTGSRAPIARFSR